MHPPGQLEILDHTADKAIIACAGSLPDLFATAAWGMFSLMIEMDGAPADQKREIAVEADSLDDLLVAWLRELQFISEVDEVVFSRFEIAQVAEPPSPQGRWRLRAAAWGGPAGDARRTGAWVKAVTYHNLSVQRRPDGAYCAQITFDV